MILASTLAVRGGDLLQPFNAPVETNSVWSATIQSNGVSTFDIELLDETNTQVIASATGITAGDDLSLAGSWVNFSSDIGLTPIDIASYMVAGSTIAPTALNTISLDFQGLTVVGVDPANNFIDNIRVTVSAGPSTEFTFFDERPLTHELTINATAGQTITLPLSLATTQVDWGDGSIDRNSALPSNTYASAGTYSVRVLGSAGSVRWDQRAVADRNALISIEQWGDLEATFLRFQNCNNLVSLPNTPIEGTINNLLVQNIFRNCTSLVTVPTNLFDNLVNTVDYIQAFLGCNSLTNTVIFKANARRFQSTYGACSSLTTIHPNTFTACVNIERLLLTFNNCSGITGAVPSLWLDTYYDAPPSGYNLAAPDYDNGGVSPVPDGNDCFQGCVNASNFGTIPIYWK